MKAKKVEVTSVKLSDKIHQTIRLSLNKQVVKDVHYIYSYSDGTIKGSVRTDKGKLKVVFNSNHNNWEVR